MLNPKARLEFWRATPGWGRILGLILLGAIAGFGQAPFDLPVLTVVAFALGLLAFENSDGHSKFGVGWALGFGYFAMTLSWLVEPFLVDLAATGWMAPFALGGMAGGLALFWGVAFRIAAGRGTLILVLCWGLAEVARSFLFGGFPWALVGYVWIDTPAYHLASIVGPYGMTLLTLMIAACFLRMHWAVGVTLILGIIAVQVVPSSVMPPAQMDRPIVRLIHPNVLQQDKWHIDKRDGIYQAQLDLAAATPAVDLIVWPETSVYLPLSMARFDLRDGAKGAQSLVGLQRRSEDGLYHNSLSLIDGMGAVTSTYDKYRLVPFGEFIPFGDALGRIGIHGLAAKDGAGFEPGEGPATIEIAGIGHVQPLICYEGIFPHDIARTAHRPDVLVLITNDAWFGTFQGPRQHFAQARARAIEFGIPVVRVANRGISAVIDPYGRSRAKLGVTDQGFLDADVPKARAATIYAQYRELSLVFLLVLLGAAALYRHGARKRVDVDSSRS